MQTSNLSTYAITKSSLQNAHKPCITGKDRKDTLHTEVKTRGKDRPTRVVFWKETPNRALCMSLKHFHQRHNVLPLRQITLFVWWGGGLVRLRVLCQEKLR